MRKSMYTSEVIERTVRMFEEYRPQHESQCAPIAHRFPRPLDRMRPANTS